MLAATAATGTPVPTESPVPADVQEVVEQMNSSASAEEKTSFLLEYLMAQREPLMNFGKTLLIALIVFLIGRKVISLLLKLLNRWMERGGVEVSVHKFIMSLGNVVLYILLIFCVAGILGVGTSSIVAIIGSAGLAVGLAGKSVKSCRWNPDPFDETVPGGRLYCGNRCRGHSAQY